jgi:hypothetical protein
VAHTHRRSEILDLVVKPMAQTNPCVGYAIKGHRRKKSLPLEKPGSKMAHTRCREQRESGVVDRLRRNGSFGNIHLILGI